MSNFHFEVFLEESLQDKYVIDEQQYTWECIANEDDTSIYNNKGELKHLVLLLVIFSHKVQVARASCFYYIVGRDI